MIDALRDLGVTIVRLAGGVVLLCVPGVALCYWLSSWPGLERLERAYLAALASLCLLTLIGMGLLEVEGRLHPWAVAYWGVACSAACAVVRAGGAIVARQQGRERRRSGTDRERGRVHGRIRVRGARGWVPARFGPLCYPTHAPSVQRARSTRRRAPGACQAVARWGRWALPRGALLGLVALTLLIYRGCGRRPGTGGGPVVAFSIPIASLEGVQAALLDGRQVTIPFRVENLGQGDEVYRVEARVPGGVGATSRVSVPAGTGCSGEVELVLPLAGQDGPVDLYLYTVEALVPAAHLRLWGAERE